MSHLSPRTLLKISETCKLLNEQAENDTVWRHSYINRFLGEGVGEDGKRREEIVVLAQSCVNVAGRGWKKEALGREVMLEYVDLECSVDYSDLLTVFGRIPKPVSSCTHRPPVLSTLSHCTIPLSSCQTRKALSLERIVNRCPRTK